MAYTISPTLCLLYSITNSLQIPANTNVLVNAFYTSHNPSVYEDPFTIKPERFLDEHGAVVPPGHPARYK